MANPHRGDTPVEVDGQTYMLCYDLNACAMVMDHLGITSFQQLGEANLGEVSLSQFLYMLWAGLQRHHPELTIDDVGAMEWDLEEISAQIGEAFERGLTKRKDEVPDEGQQGQGGGKKSSSGGTGKKRSGSGSKQG